MKLPLNHYFKHTTNCIGQNIYNLYKGSVHIGTIDNLPKNKNPCRISFLNIEPRFRRQGYGTLLLDHLQHTLKQQGHKHMEVVSTKEAVPFYIQYGFQKSGGIIKRCYYGLDEHSQFFYRFPTEK